MVDAATSRRTLDGRYRACLARLREYGQEHVLRWWGELGNGDRARLVEDVESIPWAVVGDLIDTHVRRTPATATATDLAPAPVRRQPPPPEDAGSYAEAVELGRQRLRDGKVAAFTVAGGQGTRLGYNGPKGAVVVTPVGERTLFQLFAGQVKAARDRYGAAIPWYVMTSPVNHDQTNAYFERERFFDLPPEDVSLFPQGVLPLFGFDGRMLLVDKHRLALGPDGHGGSLKALVRSGALEEMRARGIEVISYFQVDNPLVQPFDPLFLGLHAQTRSEMSTKVAAKVDDLERVGNVCAANGKVTVIEYCDFPETYARARQPDGTRRFDAGNLAIHLLSVEFVARVAGPSLQLPYRRVTKAVPCLDDAGILHTPTRPNAVKLETFVFDVLPRAHNPLVLEVDRDEEFSPIKNASGPDSLDTSRRDQTARACRWLEAAGVRVPRKPDGRPDVMIAIAPSFAVSAEEVATKRSQIPVLKPGDRVLLD